jgi:hypothetical protein
MTRYQDSTDDAAAEMYEIERIKRAAAKEERERLIKLLMDNKVLRRDGIVEAYVYIHCNTMEVLYLKDKLVEGTPE